MSRTVSGRSPGDPNNRCVRPAKNPNTVDRRTVYTHAILLTPGNHDTLFDRWLTNRTRSFSAANSQARCTTASKKLLYTQATTPVPQPNIRTSKSIFFGHNSVMLSRKARSEAFAFRRTGETCCSPPTGNNGSCIAVSAMLL